MVIVIFCISLLYVVAERRMNDLPAAAERASFYAVLEQIRSGVKLAMLSGVARQDVRSLQALEGSNPMRFALETPRNYRGEISGVNQARLVPRSWYFDTARGELLYVPGANSVDKVRLLTPGRESDTSVIRLRLSNVYAHDVGGQPVKWEGLLLRPVVDFVWEMEEELDAAWPSLGESG